MLLLLSLPALLLISLFTGFDSNTNKFTRALSLPLQWHQHRHRQMNGRCFGGSYVRGTGILHSQEPTDTLGDILESRQ